MKTASGGKRRGLVAAIASSSVSRHSPREGRLLPAPLWAGVWASAHAFTAKPRHLVLGDWYESHGREVTK